MALSFSLAARNAMLAAIGTVADADAGAARIKVYAGTPPASADSALSSNPVLVDFPCADPAFEAPSGGSIALDADPDLTANAGASGTATFARLTDQSGDVVFQGTVGTSGTDFLITTTTITSGQTINLTVGSINL